MCGIWNLAAVIGHRKSAAGVLDFVRDQDDTTLERLDEALFCSLSTACWLSVISTSATPVSLHVRTDARPCSTRHESKGESQSNSWILKLGVQRCLGSIWCSAQS